MTAARDRAARFAGSWYPGRADEAEAELDQAFAAVGPVTPAPARLLVAPHAGWRYSLPIAAAGYARVEVPATVVVLCPNHTVPPPIVSVWPGGTWHTPLGPVPVDEALAARLLAEWPGAVAEPAAHLKEHAVELHVPILQRLRRGRPLSIVPVVVAAPRLDALLAGGDGLARALAGRDDVLVVASTDMTHHEPADVARRQDERALAPLLALDPAALLDVCTREGITMCGVRPTVAGLQAALRLGATTAELARYGHSGEVSGDDDSVVGYASVIVR